jgi:hypothetical protein
MRLPKPWLRRIVIFSLQFQNLKKLKLSGESSRTLFKIIECRRPPGWSLKGKGVVYSWTTSSKLELSREGSTKKKLFWCVSPYEQLAFISSASVMHRQRLHFIGLSLMTIFFPHLQNVSFRKMLARHSTIRGLIKLWIFPQRIQSTNRAYSC